MSYTYSHHYSSTKKCQWCSRQTNQLQPKKNCNHTICNRCFIKGTSCQSDCPLCWEANITQFICVNQICSVCCTGIKPGDRRFKCSREHSQCSQEHFHCPQCTSSGCLLCQFRELTAWNDKNYRDLPPSSQHAIYTCQTWEDRFEETQKSLPNHSKFVQHNKNTPSFQEYDNKSKNDSALPFLGHQQNNSTQNEEVGDCMVCLESLGSSYETLKECGHHFHKSCIDMWFESSGKQSCPTCGYVYGISKGPQPSNGHMGIKYLPTPLPGFENIQDGYKEGPTIEITYSFPSGIQGPLNPNPNQPYSGTTRKGYLPNNKEGREILELLKKAFDDQHIFTIGRSSTTGQDNVITWNDIHHKTSIYGGPERFGYPDPTYLFRVRQELGDKGYK